MPALILWRFVRSTINCRLEDASYRGLILFQICDNRLAEATKANETFNRCNPASHALDSASRIGCSHWLTSMPENDHDAHAAGALTMDEVASKPSQSCQTLLTATRLAATQGQTCSWGRFANVGEGQTKSEMVRPVRETRPRACPALS
jgi:hypothetical protein